MAPKASLFKQKIKQARKKDQRPQQSFPIALKIDLSHQQQNIKDQLERQQQIIQQEEEKIQSFSEKGLKQILESGLGKQHKEDLTSIEQENWKQINMMSKEQLASNQAMLMAQLPQAFLKRLKILKNKKNEKNLEPIKMKQKIQIEDITKDQQKTQKQQENVSQMKECEQINIGCLQKLAINIVDSRVVYLYNQEYQRALQITSQAQKKNKKSALFKEGKQWMKISEIKLMIQSQNNQTCIIGCQIFLKMIKNISKNFKNQNQHKNFIFPLVILDNQTSFHLFQIFEDSFKFIVKSMMHKMKITRFRSSWILIYHCLMDYFTLNLQIIVQYQKYKTIISMFREFIQKKIAMMNLYSQSEQKQSKKMIQILQIKSNNSLMKESIDFLKIILQKIETINKLEAEEMQMLSDKQANIHKKQKNSIYTKQYVQNLMHELHTKAVTKDKSIIPFLKQLITMLNRNQSSTQQLIELMIKQQTQQQQNNTRTRQYCYLTFIEFLQIRIYVFLNLQNKEDLRSLLLDILLKFSSHIYCKQMSSQSPESYIKKLLIIVKQKLWSLFSFVELLPINNQNKGYEHYLMLLKQLFVFKILNETEYLSYLKEQCQNIGELSTEKENIANIITLLNFSHNLNSIKSVKNAQEKQEIITNIEQTLEFIKINLKKSKEKQSKSLIPKELQLVIFSQLLQIFSINQMQQDQSTNISEVLIDDCFKQCCIYLMGNSKGLWYILTEAKIRQLIEIYNFNSFGNYPFTRLILFIISLCKQHGEHSIQLKLLEEIVTKYPYLFYYSVHLGDFYGPEQIYGCQSDKQLERKAEDILCFNRIQEEKNNIWEFLAVKQKVKGERRDLVEKVENNVFLRYLRR